MKKILLLSTAAVAFAGAANAADIVMICKSPRQEYLVNYTGPTVLFSYAGSADAVKIDPAKTKWRKGKPIIDIASKAGADEPRRKVDFSRMEIKFYFDGDNDDDADQIDSCMSKKDHEALNAKEVPAAPASDLAAVKRDIKARCTAQWLGKDNQYSMIAYCIERELEALAKIGGY